MSWTTDLLTGVAEHLGAAGAGTWRPDGTGYASGETAIVLAVSPPEPDRLIVLTEYGPLDADGIGDVVMGLQVRTRGTTDPRVVMAIRDAVHEALDGLAHVDLSGVKVSQIFHQSGTPIGQDGNDRHERTDNYYVQARRATALRND
jgi:hypothetical protein